MSTRRLPFAALLLSAACVPVQTEPSSSTPQAIELCGSVRDELKRSAAPRFRSTGFINNGCTGVLLDEAHVLAAAHCFTNDVTGQFQNGLRFFPNFHPDRVAADPHHVARGEIDRVVVGARANNFPHNDWGIAHIGKWHDVAPGDLVFATLDGTLKNSTVLDPAKFDSDQAPERGPMENPAYVRSALAGNPGLVWDDVLCPDADRNGSKGMWQLATQPAPDGEGHGCNTRWMAASIMSGCELVTVRDDVVRHDCETWGGSSGSPYLRTKNGVTSVVGVGHGYSSPEGPLPMGGTCSTRLDCGPADQRFICSNNTCFQTTGNEQNPAAQPMCITNDHLQLNAGASASRFVDAPRFASNVAVARRPDGEDATAVFAVDSDLNRVVFRQRLGLSTNDRFSFWAPTPSVGANEATLSRIAACSDNEGRPMVFVVAKQVGTHESLLFRTRFDSALGDFEAWKRVTLQDTDASLDEDLVDVDAAYDEKGNCLLFALDRGENTISMADLTNADWSQPTVGWTTINKQPDSATGDKLTALRSADGYLWVVTIDSAANLWALGQGCLGNMNDWFEYGQVPDRQNVKKWLDVDLYWNRKGEGRLLALPLSHDNQALVQFELPDRVCGQPDANGSLAQPNNDVPIQTKLWTPNQTTGVTRRPLLTTITASRWLEDKPGITSPVIFGTDTFGNVYFISDTAGHGWSLKWQSFNHEQIFYP